MDMPHPQESRPEKDDSDFKPRVLIVHNKYQLPGGEDSVVQSEAELLSCNGHAVELYLRHNGEIQRSNQLAVGVQAIWSSRTIDEVGNQIARFKPDIVHIHNSFPLISPSVVWVAARRNVPVVMTLHNYRLICPQALLLRNGKPCEECVGTVPLPGLRHGCYRNSRAQTAFSAAVVQVHSVLGTWNRKISRYLALTDFARELFIKGGLPADKIIVRGNFVPEARHEPGVQRNGFLFVGRLSEEKGVDVLLRAALQAPGQEVFVIGDGPLSDKVRHASSNVRWLGHQSPEEIARLMRRAKALVLPSVWYENFPRVLVEAYSHGLPVIGSRLGALASLVDHRVTGLHFDVADHISLATAMALMESDSDLVDQLGAGAYRKYRAEMTPSVAYASLISAYRAALEEKASAIA
jgi:glycosyltransferase involved in cell wall biosynthesis